MISRRAGIPLAAIAGLLAAIACLNAAGLLIGNASGSVPRGLYVRADEATATFVSFCLGTRHRAGQWYPHLCSPDAPDRPRVLKRVAQRRPDHVVVAGDTPRALDSRILGPIRRDEIDGWWRPFLLVGARQ